MAQAAPNLEQHPIQDPQGREEQKKPARKRHGYRGSRANKGMKYPSAEKETPDQIEERANKQELVIATSEFANAANELDRQEFVLREDGTYQAETAEEWRQRLKDLLYSVQTELASNKGDIRRAVNLNRNLQIDKDGKARGFGRVESPNLNLHAATIKKLLDLFGGKEISQDVAERIPFSKSIMENPDGQQKFINRMISHAQSISPLFQEVSERLSGSQADLADKLDEFRQKWEDASDEKRAALIKKDLERKKEKKDPILLTLADEFEKAYEQKVPKVGQDTMLSVAELEDLQAQIIEKLKETRGEARRENFDWMKRGALAQLREKSAKKFWKNEVARLTEEARIERDQHLEEAKQVLAHLEFVEKTLGTHPDFHDDQVLQQKLRNIRKLIENIENNQTDNYEEMTRTLQHHTAKIEAGMERFGDIHPEDYDALTEGFFRANQGRTIEVEVMVDGEPELQEVVLLFYDKKTGQFVVQQAEGVTVDADQSKSNPHGQDSPVGQDLNFTVDPYNIPELRNVVYRQYERVIKDRQAQNELENQTPEIDRPEDLLGSYQMVQNPKGEGEIPVLVQLYDTSKDRFTLSPTDNNNQVIGSSFITSASKLYEQLGIKLADPAEKVNIQIPKSPTAEKGFKTFHVENIPGVGVHVSETSSAERAESGKEIIPVEHSQIYNNGFRFEGTVNKNAGYNLIQTRKQEVIADRSRTDRQFADKPYYNRGEPLSPDLFSRVNTLKQGSDQFFYLHPTPIENPSGMKFNGDKELVVENRDVYPPHGKGKLIDSFGNTIYEGGWENGVFSGFGKLDQNRPGYSCSYDYSVISYEGEFVNGKKHGAGTEFMENGNTFVGEFKDGIRDGEGDVFDATGVRLRTEVWENGELVDVQYGDGIPLAEDEDMSIEAKIRLGDISPLFSRQILENQLGKIDLDNVPVENYKLVAQLKAFADAVTQKKSEIFADLPLPTKENKEVREYIYAIIESFDKIEGYMSRGPNNTIGTKSRTFGFDVQLRHYLSEMQLPNDHSYIPKIQEVAFEHAAHALKGRVYEAFAKGATNLAYLAEQKPFDEEAAELVLLKTEADTTEKLLEAEQQLKELFESLVRRYAPPQEEPAFDVEKFKNMSEEEKQEMRFGHILSSIENGTKIHEFRPDSDALHLQHAITLACNKEGIFSGNETSHEHMKETLIELGTQYGFELFDNMGDDEVREYAKDALQKEYEMHFENGYPILMGGSNTEKQAMQDVIEQLMAELEAGKMNPTKIALNQFESTDPALWAALAEAQNSDAIIDVKVVDVNMSGLILEVGPLSGFMPLSELDPGHSPSNTKDKDQMLEELKQLKNKTLEVGILEVSQEGNRIIVSEKSTSERNQKIEKLQSNIQKTLRETHNFHGTAFQSLLEQNVSTPLDESATPQDHARRIDHPEDFKNKSFEILARNAMAEKYGDLIDLEGKLDPKYTSYSQAEKDGLRRAIITRLQPGTDNKRVQDFVMRNINRDLAAKLKILPYFDNLYVLAENLTEHLTEQQYVPLSQSDIDGKAKLDFTKSELKRGAEEETAVMLNEQLMKKQNEELLNQKERDELQARVDAEALRQEKREPQRQIARDEIAKRAQEDFEREKAEELRKFEEELRLARETEERSHRHALMEERRLAIANARKEELAKRKADEQEAVRLRREEIARKQREYRAAQDDDLQAFNRAAEKRRAALEASPKRILEQYTLAAVEELDDHEVYEIPPELEEQIEKYRAQMESSDPDILPPKTNTETEAFALFYNEEIAPSASAREKFKAMLNRRLQLGDRFEFILWYNAGVVIKREFGDKSFAQIFLED
ncbi:S1 RNA-binding domain-containing protein [Candidatus Nomurabacteria bacterium]|nr:S1 RNA-binding domain-containing protein [Candidatus Nomurabacteria bacterium]